MTLSEFANEQLTAAAGDSTNQGDSLATSMAKMTIDYMQSAELVEGVTFCSSDYLSNYLTAYAVNTEAHSIDLFYFILTETVCGKINESRINKALNNLYTLIDRILDNKIKEEVYTATPELHELAELIQSIVGDHSSEDDTVQIRRFVVTNGIADYIDMVSSLDNKHGIFLDDNIWDLNRSYRQHQVDEGDRDLEINFRVTYNTTLPCLKVEEGNEFVDTYLTFIPGDLLARIYLEYHQELLVKNVRTFLQFKGKVNKSIRKTLQEQPDYFFSYNNGISTTASEVELQETGRASAITRLKNWQIVNGAQTTASIAACSKDPKVDLSNVKVAVKISLVKDTPQSDTIVADISRFANSQTNVKQSDFSSNNPILQELSRISRKLMPATTNHIHKKWYFERTRGQYNNEMEHMKARERSAFKIEYPKDQKLTKQDIALFTLLWEHETHTAMQGTEKVLAFFIKWMNKQDFKATPLAYMRIVAMAILYREIENIFKIRGLHGYKAATCRYTLAALSYISKKRLNLTSIWDTQHVEDEVIELIEALISIVRAHITDYNGESSNTASKDILSWTKKRQFWETLTPKLDMLPPVDERLYQPVVNADGSMLNEAQNDVIEQANNITLENWKHLYEWNTHSQALTPIEKKMVENYIYKKEHDIAFREVRDAERALSIFKYAKLNGFETTL